MFTNPTPVIARLFAVLSIVVLASSCRSNKQLAAVETITPREVTATAKGDTSKAKYDLLDILRSNELVRPVTSRNLRPTFVKESDAAKAPIVTVTADEKGNKSLDIDCPCPPQQVKIVAYDRYKTEFIEVNKLTDWQIAQVWLGRLFLLILSGWLILKGLRLKGVI